jgi:glycosyltransferase involved in cell wall biosynthesis
MKLLRILPTLDPNNGGVVTAVNEFIKCIDDSVKLDILTFDDERSPWVSNYSNDIICLNQIYSSFCYNRQYTNWLRNNARNYDFVIIDGLWQYHVYGGLILKEMGVPYCVYVHGMLDPYFNKFIFKYLKKLPFWFHHTRKVLKGAHRVLFTCEEECSLAKNSFPFSKYTPAIMKLGISIPVENELQEFSSNLNELICYNHKKIALFLSRIHPKKGLDVLLRAIGLISKELRENNYLFLIAGNGDVNYINYLHKIVVDENISDLIEFVGPVYGESKWKYFLISDFFILPTHQENFGLVIAESLGVGTPVITTNKTNVWKDIRNNNCGIVCDDTPESLAEGILFWINLDDCEKSQIKINALKCYENYYSHAAMVESYESLIKSFHICRS